MKKKGTKKDTKLEQKRPKKGPIWTKKDQRDQKGTKNTKRKGTKKKQNARKRTKN